MPPQTRVRGMGQLPLKRRTFRLHYFTMCREWHAALLLSLSCWLGLSTLGPYLRAPAIQSPLLHRWGRSNGNQIWGQSCHPKPSPPPLLLQQAYCALCWTVPGGQGVASQPERAHTPSLSIATQKTNISSSLFTMCREWHAALLLSLSCWLGLSTLGPYGPLRYREQLAVMAADRPGLPMTHRGCSWSARFWCRWDW